jgi:hypothetical protein
MTTDEKLAAILAAVQTDPGNRGLARDPHDNLFTACPGDFAAACRSIATASEEAIDIDTGFFIPSGSPPSFETDGPLGAVFLLRSLGKLLQQVGALAPLQCGKAIAVGVAKAGLQFEETEMNPGIGPELMIQVGLWPGHAATHSIALEHVGRASNGEYYSMRGRNITAHASPHDSWYLLPPHQRVVTIGIGDGGNEIGMGKIPHETVVKNIPNGDLIHCRVPTDYLIVAGVSNWGAYALAAGVYVLRGVQPPPDLFDPDREREILEVMVREGPLVDGVTGKKTATVDGLSWEEYVKPLVRIREILA